MLRHVRSLLLPRRSREDQRGASAVEYGLMIAGIAAVIAVSVYAFGPTVKSTFTGTCSTFSSKASTGSC